MIKRLPVPVLALLAAVCAAASPRAEAGEPEEEIEVRVEVFSGGEGAGKFDPANITREENKVIQAAFAGGPGNSLEHVAMAADGSLYICGSLAGKPELALPWTQAPAGAGGAFVARLSPDARTMSAILRLPPAFATARQVAVAADGSVAVAGEGSGGGLEVAGLSSTLETILWRKNVPGGRVASVAVAPDGSVVVCPEADPIVSRIAADGSGLVPFGNERHFRIDGANPAVVEAWWEGCGYPAAGYKGGVTYQRGGNAGVIALPDGTFVHFSCHFLRHPGGGPDFDPMLLRFDAEGKILWCTNLLDGLPAESDHKQPRLAYDARTGDILVAAIQHGHFAHNLVFTPGSYQNPHPYFTGDIMIGWLARIDAATGKPKAATYFFPELPRNLRDGKKTANSLFPAALGADAAGNIYVAGVSAHKFETTLHAFQSEGGAGGFLAVFTPDLGRLIYASLIESPGYKFSPVALVVAGGGPVVVGNYSRQPRGPWKFLAFNADVTNYLVPEPQGARGGFLNYTPSAPWLAW